MIPYRTIMATGRPAYRDFVLADAPYAYYRFEPATGTLAADETAARRDATCQGEIQFSEPGLVAGSVAALRFGGKAAYLDVPFALDPTASAVTFEAWILTPATLPENGRQTLLAQRDGSTAGRRWLYIDAGNHDQLGTNSLNTALGGAPSATGVVTAAATRYHLVLEITPEKWRLYGNGQAQKSGEVTPETATGAFVVGTDPSLTQEPFQGAIDEIAFYTHALGGARVKAHYDASNQG
ncbi:LamG domain-containing protein [Nitrococcus mobilis]|uniref:LamG-like jellyroll fold domain-containing protein n=1 Tax=Nitrococcus mobilis Nb-231 TaxID=314278 RepID=A4BNW4_9GAMM|nr:LamG domain-containing protein [Nitrococcus mobilis]EAR22913.1 hypothetical protein NB231_10683 [Nitrococcus mobilis Nb-231]